METKFNDVKHLYLGCEMRVPGSMFTSQLLDVNYITELSGEAKPILYPLKSMSDSQKAKYSELSTRTRDFNGKNALPEIRAGRHTNYFLNTSDPYLVAFLLSEYFDLFGLIESGEAIDGSI